MVIPALSGAAAPDISSFSICPEGFSKMLAQDLDATTDLHVREAGEGDMPGPGEALFAKSGYHLMFNRNKTMSRSCPLPYGA